MGVTIKGQEQYEGLVLGTFERNGYHDSYFYAVVWNPTKRETETVQYGSTAFASSHKVVVDAGDDVREAAAEYTERVLYYTYLEQEKQKAKKPDIGDMVIVSRGRKNRGVVGRLFWLRSVLRGSRVVAHRAGLALSDERTEDGLYKRVTWDYLGNLDVKDWAEKMPDPETVLSWAKKDRDRYGLIHGREDCLQFV